MKLKIFQENGAAAIQNLEQKINDWIQAEEVDVCGTQFRSCTSASESSRPTRVSRNRRAAPDINATSSSWLAANRNCEATQIHRGIWRAGNPCVRIAALKLSDIPERALSRSKANCRASGSKALSSAASSLTRPCSGYQGLTPDDPQQPLGRSHAAMQLLNRRFPTISDDANCCRGVPNGSRRELRICMLEGISPNIETGREPL